MSKKVFVLGLLVVLAAAVFAAGPEAFVVKSVTGKVQYEAAPGTWKDVSVGQKISSSTVVNTSLNSALVVSSGNSNVTIKAMQKGTVGALATSSNIGAGIRKGATINKNGIAADTNGKSNGVSTASSRASEAKADISWDE